MKLGDKLILGDCPAGTGHSRKIVDHFSFLVLACIHLQRRAQSRMNGCTGVDIILHLLAHSEGLAPNTDILGEEALRTPEQQPVDEIETYALSPGWDRQGCHVGHRLPSRCDRPPVRDRSDLFSAWDRSDR